MTLNCITWRFNFVIMCKQGSPDPDPDLLVQVCCLKLDSCQLAAPTTPHPHNTSHPTCSILGALILAAPPAPASASAPTGSREESRSRCRPMGKPTPSNACEHTSLQTTFQHWAHQSVAQFATMTMALAYQVGSPPTFQHWVHTVHDMKQQGVTLHHRHHRWRT